MKTRRKSHRKGFKLKLKKNTVYTLFALGALLVSGLLFLSFFNSGGSAEAINQQLVEKFGGMSFLFPFVPFFFAFLFFYLELILFLDNVEEHLKIEQSLAQVILQ